jgi:hypothetical protein
VSSSVSALQGSLPRYRGYADTGRAGAGWGGDRPGDIGITERLVA